ncbi:hypothetical protein [Micromonospora humi]|uniref:PPM-type phosphatase domain-containing protein n=1 Tax=Micromonospora humi TaxID=745366 RepID=A0A1C5J0N3_9ACTN|nr:hypothetical protein [Micromonospora humi]SCG64152.1 hypothetical protein GA0070213_10854 [Micromonospora humi]
MRSGALLSMRTALAGTTGNAVLMGAAEISTPIGWVLLPGLLGVSTRPRVAALVSTWAGVLVLASVVVPVVPGHRSEPSALVASALALAAAPALAWARRRRRSSAVVRAAAPPDVAVFTMPAGPGRAALAVCGTPGEVGAAVPLRDGGLRVLVGTVTGPALATPAGRRTIELAFRRHAGQPRRSLPQLVEALDQVVRETAPAGHLHATVVQVDRTGSLAAVRCGAPDLAVVGHRDASLAGVPSSPPIGSTATAVPTTPARVASRRIAVVGAAVADAHGDDLVGVLDQVARDDDPARAAQRLTRAPGGGRRTGPVLVVDQRLPGPAGTVHPG